MTKPVDSRPRQRPILGRRCKKGFDWKTWLPVIVPVGILIFGGGIFWRAWEREPKPDVTYRVTQLSDFDLPVRMESLIEAWPALVSIVNRGSAAATGLRINLQSTSKVDFADVKSPESYELQTYSDSSGLLVTQVRLAPQASTDIIVALDESGEIQCTVVFDQGMGEVDSQRKPSDRAGDVFTVVLLACTVMAVMLNLVYELIKRVTSRREKRADDEEHG